MATEVQLRNERTGEVKQVKVGFNWFFFFCVSIFGLPLFVNRLYHYGAGMAGLSIAAAVANAIGSSMYGLFIIFQIIASVQFGRHGNRLITVNYLENGWEWADPEDQQTLFAREKWNLA